MPIPIKLANFSKESFMVYLLTLRDHSFLIKREDIYTLRNDWFTLGEHRCGYPIQRTCNALFKHMNIVESEDDYILSFDYNNQQVSMLFKFHSTDINDYDIFYLNAIKKTTDMLFSSVKDPGVLFFNENCALKNEMYFDVAIGTLNYRKMKSLNKNMDKYYIIYSGIEQSAQYLKIVNITIDAKTNLISNVIFSYRLNGKSKNIDYDELIIRLPHLSEYSLAQLIDSNNLHLKKDIPINEKDIFLLEADMI